MRCVARAVCATAVAAAVCLGPVIVAQAAPRDAAAQKKIDEAVGRLRARQYWQAEMVLLTTLRTCADQCRPQLMARIWMYLGIIRADVRKDEPGAAQAFALALHADPYVKFDQALATPKTTGLFVRQRARLAAGKPKSSAPPPLPPIEADGDKAKPDAKQPATARFGDEPAPKRPATKSSQAASKPSSPPPSEESLPPYMVDSPKQSAKPEDLPPGAEAPKQSASSGLESGEADLVDVLMKPEPKPPEPVAKPAEPAEPADKAEPKELRDQRPAPDTDGRFARGGQVVLSANRLFGFYFWSASVADGGASPSGSSFALFSPSSTTGMELPYNPYAAPYFGLDVFVADRMSVGGSVSYTWVGKEVGDPSAASLSAFGVYGRLGACIELGGMVSFWPRAGVTHFWASLGAGQVDYGYALWALTFEVPFVLVPTKGAGFLVGPVFDVPFSGARNVRLSEDEASEAGMSFFNWGVATGLFVYL